MTDKSSRWQFTAYEPQFKFLDTMPPIVAEWGWQDEICPTSGRLHKQGFMRTTQQQRFTAMRKAFPGLHMEIARDWHKLLNYCKKKDTAVPDSTVHQTNDIPSLFTYSEELAKRLAEQQRIRKVDYGDVDLMVRKDIESGRKGIEWIATNPQFITTWKKYWYEMIIRARYPQTDRQTDNETISDEEYNAPGETSAEAEVQDCSEGDIRCPAQSGEYSSPQEASCDTTAPS